MRNSQAGPVPVLRRDPVDEALSALNTADLLEDGLTTNRGLDNGRVTRRVGQITGWNANNMMLVLENRNAVDLLGRTNNFNFMAITGSATAPIVHRTVNGDAEPSGNNADHAWWYGNLVNNGDAPRGTVPANLREINDRRFEELRARTRALNGNLYAVVYHANVTGNPVLSVTIIADFTGALNVEPRDSGDILWETMEGIANELRLTFVATGLSYFAFNNWYEMNRFNEFNVDAFIDSLAPAADILKALADAADVYEEVADAIADLLADDAYLANLLAGYVSNWTVGHEFDENANVLIARLNGFITAINAELIARGAADALAAAIAEIEGFLAGLGVDLADFVLADVVSLVDAHEALDEVIDFIEETILANPALADAIANFYDEDDAADLLALIDAIQIALEDAFYAAALADAADYGTFSTFTVTVLTKTKLELEAALARFAALAADDTAVAMFNAGAVRAGFATRTLAAIVAGLQAAIDALEFMDEDFYVAVALPYDLVRDTGVWATAGAARTTALANVRAIAAAWGLLSEEAQDQVEAREDFGVAGRIVILVAIADFYDDGGYLDVDDFIYAENFWRLELNQPFTPSNATNDALWLALAEKALADFNRLRTIDQTNPRVEAIIARAKIVVVAASEDRIAAETLIDAFLTAGLGGNVDLLIERLESVSKRIGDIDFDESYAEEVLEGLRNKVIDNLDAMSGVIDDIMDVLRDDDYLDDLDFFEVIAEVVALLTFAGEIEDTIALVEKALAASTADLFFFTGGLEGFDGDLDDIAAAINELIGLLEDEDDDLTANETALLHVLLGIDLEYDPEALDDYLGDLEDLIDEIEILKGLLVWQYALNLLILRTAGEPDTLNAYLNTEYTVGSGELDRFADLEALEDAIDDLISEVEGEEGLLVRFEEFIDELTLPANQVILNTIQKISGIANTKSAIDTRIGITIISIGDWLTEMLAEEEEEDEFEAEALAFLAIAERALILRALEIGGLEAIVEDNDLLNIFDILDTGLIELFETDWNLLSEEAQDLFILGLLDGYEGFDSAFWVEDGGEYDFDFEALILAVEVEMEMRSFQSANTDALAFLTGELTLEDFIVDELGAELGVNDAVQALINLIVGILEFESDFDELEEADPIEEAMIDRILDLLGEDDLDFLEAILEDIVYFMLDLVGINDDLFSVENILDDEDEILEEWTGGSPDGAAILLALEEQLGGIIEDLINEAIENSGVDTEILDEIGGDDAENLEFTLGILLIWDELEPDWEEFDELDATFIETADGEVEEDIAFVITITFTEPGSETISVTFRVYPLPIEITEE
jgi:hypothetical protein